MGLKARALGLVAAATALLLVAAPLAQAEDYNVDDNNIGGIPDNNICELFEAITAANTDTLNPTDCNAGTGDDAINLAFGTYSISSPLQLGDSDAGDTTLFGGTGAPVTIAHVGAPERVIQIIGPVGGVTLNGLTITGGNFFGSSAGGGILVSGTTSLTVTDSTIHNNSISNGAGDGDGGGIGVSGANAPLTLTNVTLSGNTAEGDGGGISSQGSNVTMNNVTVVGNTADFGATAGGNGGGVRTSGTPTLTFNNSVIAGNSDVGGQSPDCILFGTPVLTGNLLGDNTGCAGFTGGTGNDVNVASGLSPTLANNGGPTFTLAPLDNSLAIDTGVAATCPALDQRGYVREQGPECDRGAVEAQPPVLAAIGNKTVQAGQNLAFTISATDVEATDVLTYGASGLPAGASVNPTTGAFSWTPTAGQVGDALVSFEVSDGTFGDSEPVTITVTPAPPTTTPPAPTPVITPPAATPTTPAAKKCKKSRKLKRGKCVKKKKKK